MKLPVLFRDMPIRSKLTFITVLSAGTALLFAALIIMVYQWFLFRAGLEKTTHVQAHIVAANIASALVFNDPKSASRTLEALGVLDNIEFAILHDRQGNVFALYARAGQKPSPSHSLPEQELLLYTATYLDAFHPVFLEDERVGTLHVRSSLAPIYQKMAWSTAAVTAAGLAGLGLALLLIATLHPAITGPIAKLIGLMGVISSEKNYALRADAQGQDELATLGREFNDMLVQIQARDTALAQHRAQLEQEVARRTASLTEAQHIAHLGSWEWDIVHDTLIWSDETYRIFGLTPQQFDATYEAFMQVVHPDDRQRVEEGGRQAIEQGQAYSQDHRILLPGGTVRHVHEQGEATLKEGGRATRMAGTVQDITERKQAAQALEESERKFRAIVDATVDGILVADVQTHKFVIANRAICDMLGYPMDELYRLGVEDIHPAEALTDVQKTFERQLKGEMRMAQNMPVKRKDGSVFFADVSASPIVLKGHTFLLGAFHDVTERMQVEERIRDSEARYRSIFEYANDVIILLNADGTFRSISPAGERITGWKAEEWTGKPFVSLIHADDLAAAGAAFQKALAGESISSLRLRVATKSGEYFSADISVTPLGRDLIMGIARDVSERQRVEAEIRRLNEELESKVQERTRQLLEAQEDLVRKEKLAVLGQVAGSVGHELRNPLGVMNNAVYFLQTVLSDADETTQEYLNIIKDEIADSERIVSDLLDSVRTKPPRPEAVGVETLIGQTLRKCVIPPTVTVELDIPEMLSPLQVDAQQIHQVFRNLISNGVEAMPEGGTLEIRAVENKPEGQIVISVRDTGTGIAPDVLPRLFQPLFTTKARGIGLGLVVVKNLTQANGGEIAVQSEVGQGTTFTVTLPTAHSFVEEG
jgi:PAS domain S-box-containing protein